MYLHDWTSLPLSPASYLSPSHSGCFSCTSRSLFFEHGIHFPTGPRPLPGPLPWVPVPVLYMADSLTSPLERGLPHPPHHKGPLSQQLSWFSSGPHTSPSTFPPPTKPPSLWFKNLLVSLFAYFSYSPQQLQCLVQILARKGFSIETYYINEQKLGLSWPNLKKWNQLHVISSLLRHLTLPVN